MFLGFIFITTLPFSKTAHVFSNNRIYHEGNCVTSAETLASQVCHHVKRGDLSRTGTTEPTRCPSLGFQASTALEEPSSRQVTAKLTKLGGPIPDPQHEFTTSPEECHHNILPGWVTHSRCRPWYFTTPNQIPVHVERKYLSSVSTGESLKKIGNHHHHSPYQLWPTLLPIRNHVLRDQFQCGGGW